MTKEKLRLWRLSQKVSQMRLAQAAGVSRNRISLFESGYLPSLRRSEQKAIAEILNSNMTERVGGKNEN